ncbi:putative lipase [Wickerhamomyces ciferrii]|uniref:triacylglycerol lipase n=1 Tax=Wickerhamomyces ciferrii (strain ATCC 14091 / BCRC 22168 / CBS 111 / JCM 3599 / NBRC 0793 / NRRL Y-1031 F-60-10) TaxID=1206466 RepID=K0KKK4_WICCF|nr:putative lipase [Wickerhamomyces ciferrii]CCH42687.1 putative lipase [Wickerhamomyces ciferrii]
MAGSTLNLSDEELRKLLEDISQEIRDDDSKDTTAPDDKRPKKHQNPPAILPLVVDCANYSRLAYGIPTLPEKFKDVSLDLLRKPTNDHIEDDKLKELELFNQSLAYYKERLSELSDKVDILKSFKVDDQGGTSYIAVDHDKKYLIVAFKGTKTKDEWLKTNFSIRGIKYKPLNPWGKSNENLKDVDVHEGFYTAIKNLIEDYDIFKTVQKYIDEYKDYKLIITGHSLGGALAALFGIEAQVLGWNPLIITLAAPKIAYVDRPGLDILTSGPSFPEKIEKLFDITVDKVTQTYLDLKGLIKSDYGTFINIEHIGDIVPLVPLAPYERLGGIPYLLRSTGPIEINKFLPQALEIDANEDLTDIKDNENYARRTYKDQKWINDKLSKEKLFYNTTVAIIKENLTIFDSPQTTFIQKLAQLLEFGDIFDKLVEIHCFYTLYDLSLDGNAIEDFVEGKQ